MYVTSAYDAEQQITLTGYYKKLIVGQVTYTVNNLTPTLIDPNFGAVTKVEITHRTLLPPDHGTGPLGYHDSLIISDVQFALAGGLGSSIWGSNVYSITTDNPDGIYRPNEKIEITLSLSAKVHVKGHPQLLLNSGGVATYVGGSNTKELKFEYVVGRNDSTNGDQLDVFGFVPGTAVLLSNTSRTFLHFPELTTSGALHFSSDIIISKDVADQKVTIGFEDLILPPEETALVNPYRGFEWNTPVRPVYALDALTYEHPGSGYTVGNIGSGHVVAYTPFAEQPVDIHRANNDSFVFQRVALTAAWDSSLEVTLTGYNKGRIVGTETVVVTDSSHKWVTVNWGLIDDLKISTANGVLDPQWASIPGVANHLVMDNFTFLV